MSEFPSYWIKRLFQRTFPETNTEAAYTSQEIETVSGLVVKFQIVKQVNPDFNLKSGFYVLTSRYIIADPQQNDPWLIPLEKVVSQYLLQTPGSVLQIAHTDPDKTIATPFKLQEIGSVGRWRNFWFIYQIVPVRGSRIRELNN